MNIGIYSVSLAICIFTVVAGDDQPDASLPPIQVLEGIHPEQNVFDAADKDTPLILRTADDAAPYFTKDALESLKQNVDFEQQLVLVFAWQGSGQDRIEYVVQESFPEQIAFTFRPGKTRDLRQHVHMYALRSDVTWTID